MDARETTANNADLWTQYFRQQWRVWLDPFGLTGSSTSDAIGRAFAEVAAANMAGILSLFLGPAVGRAYRANADGVTEALYERAIAPESVDIPAEYAYVPVRERNDFTQREWSSPRRDLATASV